MYIYMYIYIYIYTKVFVEKAKYKKFGGEPPVPPVEV